MRLFSLGLLTALFVPLAAYAQAPKQVEVTNLPAVQEVTGAVQVTNLPVASPPARFQLVGFTSTTIAADVGTYGATLACQAEFPLSRICLYVV